VAVLVAVLVAVAVPVLVRVAVRVGVRVTVAVLVAVRVGVLVGVDVRVGVLVAVLVGEGVGVKVAVAVYVGVGTPTTMFPPTVLQPAVPVFRNNWQVLNVRPLLPSATPLNVIVKSTPLPDIGLAQAAATFACPAAPALGVGKYDTTRQPLLAAPAAPSVANTATGLSYEIQTL